MLLELPASESRHLGAHGCRRVGACHRLRPQRPRRARDRAHRFAARFPGDAAAVFPVRSAGDQFSSSSSSRPGSKTSTVNYHLGIDGISLLLILLNSFTTVLVVIAGWQVIQSRVAQYMAAFCSCRPS